MNHLVRFTKVLTAPRIRSLAARRRPKGLTPVLEGLEERVVLSTIQWNTSAAPKGGAWDTASNWVGDQVPGYSDAAVIDLSSAGTVTTGPNDSVLTLSTNAATTMSVSNGTLSLHAGTSTINGPLTVDGSGTLWLNSTSLIGSGAVTDAGMLDALGCTLGSTSITMSSGSTFKTDSGGVLVSSGATLKIATGASVDLFTGISVSGQLTITDASVAYHSGDGLVVNNGGTMTATGSSFSGVAGDYALGRVEVSSGGHLIASNSSFSIGSFTLDAGSILNSGDLSSNAFNTTLTAPITDVPLLTNNMSFDAVDLTGGLVSGQAVTLLPMGTQSTANQYYVVPDGLRVSSGAALTIGTSSTVYIADEQTISVSGLLTVAGASVALDKNSGGGSSGIVINQGGTMTATGSSFASDGVDTVETTDVEVKSGGHLIASNTTFAIDDLSLDSASTEQLTVDVFATQFNVNSGASLSITQDDFSNGTVVASGTPTATINLADNYWGTTTASQIAAKITDHHTNASLPTVSYASPLSAAAPAGAATTIVASGTTATYNANASQSVTLSASLTSGSVKPGAGTVTFILVNRISMIGQPVTATVNSGGSASTTILLPAGTLGGVYTIVAIYDGTASYLGSLDVHHAVKVNPAPATTTAAAASDTFGALAAQTVNLSATVSSPNGTVNEGTETFTILAGSSPVGSPVTAPVVDGAAAAAYSIPAGTRAGTYTIRAVYNGTADYSSATDTAHLLTVGPAATTTSSLNTSTTYGAASHTVTLSASVTSAVGTVGEGTVTFTVLSGSKSIGSAVSAAVSKGTASATYTLPAGLAGGRYTIKAVYDGGPDFRTSTDTAHSLTVNPAATITAAANQTIAFSTAAHTAKLTATVTSSAGTVGEGTVTFTILHGTTVVGQATTGNVAGGKVSVNYTIPANTAVGTYTIKAVYNGTGDFLTAIDTAHVLTISPSAASTAISLAAIGGSGAAAVPQAAQSAPLGAIVDGAASRSASRTAHRSRVAINRGPLSIGRSAAATRAGAGHISRVADRRSGADVRPSPLG